MNIALIAAAGSGQRMGRNGKQFLPVRGQPLISYTLQSFQDAKKVDEIVVVTNQKEIDYCWQKVVYAFNISKVSQIVAGGMRRQDSVYHGLKVLPLKTNRVIIHDGARPLVKSEEIDKIISACDDCDGVVMAVPVVDTVKKIVSFPWIEETLERENLWQAQTPQVFPYEVIMDGYRKAYLDEFFATDDAALVERLGYKVKIFKGSYENIKVTTKEDLMLVELFLSEREKK